MFAEARPLLAELCQDDVLPLVPVTAGQRAMMIAAYGRCLARLNQLDYAEPVLLRAHRSLHESGQSTGEAMLGVLRALVSLCESQNRPDEAAKWREELTAAIAATQPAAPG
jgi:hypothetical protein